MIQVMLDQEDDPNLDYQWLTDEERLTRVRKDIDQIVGRVKGEESPSIKVPQYSKEYIVVRERVPNRTEWPSFR